MVWHVDIVERKALVESMNMKGDWKFTLDADSADIVVSKHEVTNSRRPGPLSGMFSSSAHIEPADTREAIIQKAFAVMQFLADHELREFFTVGGEVVFDPHSWDSPRPADVDECRRFFIGQRGAVLGPPIGKFRVPDGLHGAKG